MSRMIRYIVTSACILILVAACREPDRPLGPGSAGIYVVRSDPAGAAILVNGEDTGLVTPDTLFELRANQDTVTVRLDTGTLTYGYSFLSGPPRLNGVTTVSGPLVLACSTAACLENTLSVHREAEIEYVVSAAGAPMTQFGSGDGLQWPASVNNSYVSGAMPVISGVIAGIGDTVALGVYDFLPRPSLRLRGYGIGRPAPVIVNENGRRTARQTMWVVPPADLLNYPTIRGIEIRQDFTTVAGVEDVLLVHIMFRNITGLASYQTVDPVPPASGRTYESVFIGFAVDADVANADSDVGDDALSYIPDRQMVFVYDSDFSVPDFTGGWADRPGLIGLRVVNRPAGTRVVLNGWPKLTEAGEEVDWSAGTLLEASGLRWMSGTQTAFPDHADPAIGHAPDSPADYRMVAAAGPLTLAPGDSAEVTLAIMLAPPVAGSYTSGTNMPPGDPKDTSRDLYDTALELIDRADAAASLTGGGG